MLYYSAVFLIVALVSAFFGFSPIAEGSASVAQLLFIVFFIVAAATLLFNLHRPGPKP